MKSYAALAFAGAVAAFPQPQAVTSALAPSQSAPAGCSPNYSGQFQISVVNVTKSKRSLEARQQDTKALEITLSNGKLTDNQGRTGYIASNRQFQFDNPIQAGAIYTTGFSACSNGTLALGGSSIFYQCLSGNFYNLYDQSTGGQCSPIYIDIIGGGASSSAAAQTTGAVTSSPKVSQITDGQVQATTATPRVSQISDGQIQASTGKPVTQISDGQIQASTGKPVTQISDGQIQAPTSTSSRAAVTQISDGQIQAPTSTRAPVTQISDGQIQAPTSTRAPVSQISDGQIQAPTNGTTPTRAAATPSVSVFTGSANNVKAGFFGLAAGAVAVAML